MLGGSARRRADRELRRPVAAAAQRPQRAAELGSVPRLRRQPAPVLPPRNRAALRQHRPRETGGPRSADRRLYVLNERLARHYGVAGVYGSHFRRVPVKEDARRGLLGQGSILAVTSHAERTSPVLRGKWVLENLLGLPVPPPPPDVPQLTPPKPGEAPKTLREQMEVHRSTPVCASCHRVDGSDRVCAREFRPVGAWRVARTRWPNRCVRSARGRDEDRRRRRIATRDPFPSGDVRRDDDGEAADLRAGSRPRDYDMPVVRRIVARRQARPLHVSSIVRGIVRSTPFQMRIRPLSEKSVSRRRPALAAATPAQ